MDNYDDEIMACGVDNQINFNMCIMLLQCIPEFIIDHKLYGLPMAGNECNHGRMYAYIAGRCEYWLT